MICLKKTLCLASLFECDMLKAECIEQNKYFTLSIHLYRKFVREIKFDRMKGKRLKEA